jgi:hypothetical protein
MSYLWRIFGGDTSTQHQTIQASSSSILSTSSPALSSSTPSTSVTLANEQALVNGQALANEQALANAIPQPIAQSIQLAEPQHEIAGQADIPALNSSSEPTSVEKTVAVENTVAALSVADAPLPTIIPTTPSSSPDRLGHAPDINVTSKGELHKDGFDETAAKTSTKENGDDHDNDAVWTVCMADNLLQLDMIPIYKKCLEVSASRDRLTMLAATVTELRYANDFAQDPVRPVKCAVQMKRANWTSLPTTTIRDFAQRLKEAEQQLKRCNEIHEALEDEVADMGPELWAWWQHQLHSLLTTKPSAEGLYVWVVNPDSSQKNRVRLHRQKIKRLTTQWCSHDSKLKGVINIEPIDKKSNQNQVVHFTGSYVMPAENDSGTLEHILFLPSPVGNEIERTLIQSTFSLSDIAFIYE